ncbi:MAG: hypothetical protein WAW90_02160, partial [Minisyncoccia bacterium]
VVSSTTRPVAVRVTLKKEKTHTVRAVATSTLQKAPSHIDPATSSIEIIFSFTPPASSTRATTTRQAHRPSNLKATVQTFFESFKNSLRHFFF